MFAAEIKNHCFFNKLNFAYPKFTGSMSISVFGRCFIALAAFISGV